MRAQQFNWSSLLTLALAVPVVLTFLAVLYLRTGEDEPLITAEVATGEWAPFSGEQLPEKGIASAIVAAVLQEMGYEPEFRFLAWGQAYEAARRNESRGGIQGTFPWFRTEDRERDFYVSEPLLTTRSAVFYHAERTPQVSTVTDVEALARYRGLRIASYEYASEVKALMASAPEELTNLKAFERLLGDSTVDFVIEAEEVGKTILREQFPEGRSRIHIAPLHWEIGVHFLASRSNPNHRALVNDFDEVLEKIRADGRYEALVRRVQDQINASRTVTLHPFGADGSLVGYLDATNNLRVLLPRGSRAVVEDWGDAYLNPTDNLPTNRPSRVRVVLLNGPLTGTTLHVDGRAVQLP